MTAWPQNRLRSLFATLCLVAVVSLYTPLGGAAWVLYSTACCTPRQCPIKGHHAQQLPAAPEHAMDCGHNMTAMTQCGLSCCHNPDRPALLPVSFVLPAPFAVSPASSSEALVVAPEARDTFYLSKPLSPPPRISSFTA